MARKESQDLIDKIDEAIDIMNIEMPNWRTNLFNLYYGSPDRNVQVFRIFEAITRKSNKSNGHI